jgi:hypothetical protein
VFVAVKVVNGATLVEIPEFVLKMLEQQNVIILVVLSGHIIIIQKTSGEDQFL